MQRSSANGSGHPCGLGIYYGLPLFLLVYFGVALVFLAVPRLGGELFPFFTFRLYSRIPSSFTDYDVHYRTPSGAPATLGERGLGFLTRKRLTVAYRSLAEGGLTSDETAGERVLVRASLLPGAGAAFLVRRTGSFAEAYHGGAVRVDTLGPL